MVVRPFRFQTCLALGLALVGCGKSPEEFLVHKWEEVRWSYEKTDRTRREIQRFDGIRIDAFEGRFIRHHEAEYWWFKEDRSFAIALEQGTILKGRWRLKGRGHILTLRYEDGAVEVYDIKELNGRQMVLNLDLGMEVRGIARLDFSRDGEVAQMSQRPHSSRERFMPPVSSAVTLLSRIQK